MRRFCPLVPPANAHQWAWAAGGRGDGRGAELGRHWENTPVLGGPPVCSFIKPAPPAWLAGRHKLSKLTRGSTGGSSAASCSASPQEVRPGAVEARPGL